MVEQTPFFNIDRNADALVKLVGRSRRILHKRGESMGTNQCSRTWARGLLRRGYSILKTLTPQNAVGDKILHFIHFVSRHRRLPKKQQMFNDVIYNIKTTEEIRDPLRNFVSDKEYLKIYVKALIGDKYNVPTLAVLRDEAQVAAFEFPYVCCIKPTHLSRNVLFRTDGEDIDRNKIRSWFSINHYLLTREANYKYLKPKVIIEPLIFGVTNLEDYKFFCFNGEPKLIQVDLDRSTHHTRLFFDNHWNEYNFSLDKPKNPKTIVKPKNFEKMLAVARALSQQFSMIRVDLYSDNSNVHVGELTNTHGNAGERFIPRSSESVASRILFGSSN